MNEKLPERIADALKSGIVQGSAEESLEELGKTLLREAGAENDVVKLIVGKMLLSITEKLGQA